MPLTPEQLQLGANYQMQSYTTDDPIDQFSTERPLAKWLIAHKIDSVYGNGIFNEKVRFTNDSNYQNFSGDDQLTHNRKDTARLAPYQHYEAYDGFSLNATELANNGIIITDDKTAQVTEAEKNQIVSKLDEGWTTLKDGFQENLDIEFHLDGSANPKAMPGLDALVSTTPTVGTIGGIDAALPWWQNWAVMGISTATAGNLIETLEALWRKTITYGKLGAPDFIPVGSAMYDALVKDANKVTGRSVQLGVSSTGGVTIDPTTKAIYLKGVQVVWDPTFDALDEALGAITYPWKKRGYFLNSKSVRLRPFKGRWMIRHTPPRVYDRMTYYFGMSTDSAITCRKRNSNAVFSIA